MRIPRGLKRALFSAMVFPVALHAAEWSAEPRISARSGYNDNIRLTTLPHDSVWETALTPAIKFGVAKEHQGLFGDASASIRRFFGGSGRESSSILDREDYYLKTNAYHRTERDEFSALLNYTRDSTLDSELDETGQVISDRATRSRITLGPNWTRSLNELTQLNLGYSFTAVSYSDDPGISDLVDYDYDVYSASLTRQFTPKVQATLATSYSSYKPDSGFDADTINLQVGITRQFTETFSTSWLAGVRQTTSDKINSVSTGFCLGADPGASYPSCAGGRPVQTGILQVKDETDDSGSVFSISATKLLETGKVSASLSRASNPGGDGELLDTTRLLISGEHKFTETLRSSLSLEYSKVETIVNSSGTRNQTDEDLYRIRPKLFWRWRREWQLGAEYEYSKRDENLSNADTATRNAFYLSLTYHQPKISVSR
jgi:hypothetical protein